MPHPKQTQNLGGSWSAISAAGEATNLNLVHLMNVDCTNVEDLTKVCNLFIYPSSFSLTICYCSLSIYQTVNNLLIYQTELK